MGALLPPIGSGVKAVIAICAVFAGLTAMFGSLSCRVSPLSDWGMMLTTLTMISSGLFDLREDAGGRFLRIEVLGLDHEVLILRHAGSSALPSWVLSPSIHSPSCPTPNFGALAQRTSRLAANRMVTVPGRRPRPPRAT